MKLKCPFCSYVGNIDKFRWHGPKGDVYADNNSAYFTLTHPGARCYWYNEKKPHSVFVKVKDKNAFTDRFLRKKTYKNFTTKFEISDKTDPSDYE